MRSILGLTAAAVVLVATLIVAASQFVIGGAPQAACETEGPFVMHEWGTFTSFTGSDGVKLEFRPLEDVDLPPFVLDRVRQTGMYDPLSKRGIAALNRMETPVTYFYTDEARRAKVRVGFPEGLLTEFYPPVETLKPDFDFRMPTPIRDSSLDWGDVWIVPEDRLTPNVADEELAAALRGRLLESILPQTDANDHYTYARETDSALVYVERERDKSRPLAHVGGFFEKFLFYRGVGNFDLPLKLTAESDGRFELQNLGAAPIRSLFLVTVEGERLQFVKHDEIRPGKSLTLKQTDRTSPQSELAEAVVQSLIDEKLYEKEARAMVKTWQASWFGEDGTRLFYMLPRTTTDELLPLEIEPPPDESVRVMVGRLEIMTPGDEARITELVRQSYHDRLALARRNEELPEEKQSSRFLPQSIIDLGRLGEPALIRIKHIAEDSLVRGEAESLLWELREYRRALAAQ